jgi:hypothetical protein
VVVCLLEYMDFHVSDLKSSAFVYSLCEVY